MDSGWWIPADGFRLTDSGWDETGPRTRARARPLARGGGELSSVVVASL